MNILVTGANGQLGNEMRIVSKNTTDHYQVRQKQAELAREAGVTSFCYYDYWFGDGKVALDLPLKEVVRLGEPDFPFCLCWANPYSKTEGTVLSLLTNIQFKHNYSRFSLYKNLVKKKIAEYTKKPLMLYSYKEALNYLLDPILAEDRVIPVVFPNWDYTPRRGASDLIFHDATPELFKKHVIQALHYIKNKPVDKQIVFVKSWNEWGEGNYMEPDMEFGKGRIKALKDAIYEVKQEIEKK